MEGSESTARERTTGTGSQVAEQKLLSSTKPLYRFTRKEPRSLGIVIVMFGCAEILMGFNLKQEEWSTSCVLFIPFWQGALFLVCGILSIYTDIHPSKKMLTVCLAMYGVSLFGIGISVGYRIYLMCYYSFSYMVYRSRARGEEPSRVDLVRGVESILLSSSLCVSGLLIFLCVVSRLALKSTNTQFILQYIPAAPPAAPAPPAAAPAAAPAPPAAAAAAPQSDATTSN
ncbi:uncharacterized protein LOC131981809 [Centropristis striata]|uniref:uncharacterized protein LOC131981809 n=1 Tax=Centropristis striata TaxID=184440 RepID=UPI0027DF405E|nr:uncharacterized protein LOC131981809 [Centropristis striata]XP_059202271.1 uncharacterized protein LOC131981809 [Centropristis striata]